MISRGQIYFVNLSLTQGREQAGRRPVLVEVIPIVSLFCGPEGRVSQAGKGVSDGRARDLQQERGSIHRVQQVPDRAS